MKVSRALVIWSVMVIVAVALKLLQVPGASALLFITTPGFTAMLLSIIIWGKTTELVRVLFVVNMLWVLFLVYSNLFRDGYPYNHVALIIYCGVFIIFLGKYRFINFKKKIRKI